MKLPVAAAALRLLLQLPSSAAVAETATSVVDRSLQTLTGTFSPLTCNTNLDGAACSTWSSKGFSTNEAGVVTIPCNECVTMSEFTGSETVTVGGLNVLGRLDFPDGTKVTVETPHVFVQGKLSMSSTSVVSGTPDVKIVMTGDADQILTPEAPNGSICSGGSCNVGPKAIVVAGGQLDIDALSDTCPTWSLVQDYTDAGMPNPTSGYPIPPTFDSATQSHCADALLSSDFEDGSLGEGGMDWWWGNLGAPAGIETTGGHDGSKYLQVSRRTDTWQGPYRELRKNHEKTCLMPDAVYFFSAKVKLEASSLYPGHVSQCSLTGDSCPGLRFQYMKPDDYVVWEDLVVADSAPADGTWFDISGSFETEAEWVDPANIFATVAINGPEKEVDIAVDDFKIELAPASAYPDPANVCADLASNGDAESGVAFPFRNYVASLPLSVVDDGTGSNYVFYVTGREKQYHTLAFEIVTGCAVPGSAYTFSADVKVESSTDLIPRLQLKIEKEGQANEFQNAGTCPRVGSNRGFVKCILDVTFTQEVYDADRVTAFVNLFPATSGDAEPLTSDAYFDNVSFVFKAGLATGGIQLSGGASPLDACYAAGAKAVIPSDDLSYSRAQEVTLSSVDGSNMINLEENTARIPTQADVGGDAAGQVAFLSRNVEFSGDGGTLTVLGTSAAQTIKGAAFVGFGQEGLLGRSPIAFSQAGDSTGSSVKKNAISASKNRCVHISGSDNIEIHDNVAYDTLGHCYALQEGTETGNAFVGNLGALTRKASTLIAGESDDTDPATFYISAPGNAWSSNVAGGSESSGFLFDTLSTDSVTSFADNIAHSNLIAGVNTESYNPSTATTLSNTKAFRNNGSGLRLGSSSNLVLDGGYAADNRDGVLVWLSDSITVKNMAIVGQTDLYKELSAGSVPGTPKLCTGFSDGPSVGGVRVHPNSGPSGTAVESVTFSGYDADAGCQPPSGGDTAAIAIVGDDSAMSLSYNTTFSVTGLTFEAGAATADKVKLCGPAGRGIYEVVVNDLDRSLAPPSASGTGSGTVMSEYMTCSSGPIALDGSCAQYCDGGTVAPGAAPSPSGDSSPSGPSGTASTCIANGNFENGLDPWFAGPSTVWSAAETTAGKDGGTAAKSRLRRNPSMSGLWQNFAPDCLTPEAWYEISADIRFINNQTLAPHPCDPYNMWYGSPSSCPFATLVLNRNPLDRVDIAPVVGPLNTEGEQWQKMYGAFKATADYISAGVFPIIFSSAPDNVDLIIDNVRVDVVTDVSASVGAVDCASPVVNGDFETGDLRGWFARGNSNGGDLSAVAGVGGMGTAVRHDGARTQRWHGILQLVPHECFTDGSTWQITAKFRMFDKSGTAVTCDKTDPLADNSCPTFELSPNGDRNWPDRELPMANIDSGDMVVGQWNNIVNNKVINAAHANFDTRYSWLTINSVDPQYVYEIDDIVITRQ